NQHYGEDRSHHPPVRNQDSILLQVGQQVSPTCDRFAGPQSQEGQRDFRHDELRYQNHRLSKDQRFQLGKNVAAKNVELGSAEAAGGHHEAAFFGAKRQAANESRRTRPPSNANYAREQEEGFERRDAQRQERADGQQKITMTMPSPALTGA